MYGRSQAEHDARLKALLQRLAERGLTLRKEKCRFDQTYILWFGYLFTPEGMFADPNKVAAIREADDPKSKEEVRSLLQTLQFNQQFIVPEAHGHGTYADLTAPMRELLKDNSVFRWSEECVKSMATIQKLLCSDVVIAPFDPKKDTKLYMDRSPVGSSRKEGDIKW